MHLRRPAGWAHPAQRVKTVFLRRESQAEQRQTAVQAAWKGLVALEALVESVDSARRVNNLLLASVERVTFGTDFQVNVFTDRGIGLDHVAAAASRCDFFILRMDFRFHGNF